MTRKRAKVDAQRSNKPKPINPFGNFEAVPLYLRVGPWTLIAKVYLIVLGIIIVCTSIMAFSEYSSLSRTRLGSSKSVAWIRLLIGIYCLFIYLMVFWGEWKQGKLHATKTFTLYSWLLLCIRLFFCGIAHWNPFLLQVSEIIRYPVIVQHTTVFLLWWFVFGPFIVYLMRNDEAQLKAFLKFNRSFTLINLHGLNLVIASLDFIYDRRPMSFFDIWITILLLYIYMLFYTIHCESNNLHFYALLSPRTKWCLVTYTVGIGIFYSFLTFWNSVAVRKETF